jgi:prophage regulatory protein
MSNHTTAKLIRLEGVMTLTGMSRSSVFSRRASDPTFPKPIKLGRAAHFVQDEIVEWVNAQLAAR